MPAKSRRKRGKSLPPSKRIHAGTVAASTSAQPETKATEPVIAQLKPAVTRKMTAAPVQVTVTSFPFIKTELLTISILGVVMVVILIILSFIL